jgi:DNA mismatch endonuclease (patch repair protein)
VRLSPPSPTSAAASAVMRGNRRKDTRPEIAVRSELHRRGLRFYKNRRPVRDFLCEADIVFPRARVAVFVDGCFWHGCPDHGTRPASNSGYWNAKIDGNTARDRRNDEWLRSNGWLIVRGWEHEPAGRIADRVESALLESSGGGNVMEQRDDAVSHAGIRPSQVVILARVS